MHVSPPKPDRPRLGQLSDMDVRLLKVYKSVVDCGGMAAAELELNIGASTVSRHVKDLETRLGLVLCRRGRAGFSLTTDGRRVYEEVIRLLSAMDSFRDSIDGLHQRLGGRLEVALFDKIASNSDAKVDQALGRFTELAPEVELHVHTSSTNTIERGILDGQFHVGIVPAHRRSKSLCYADLFSETMHLYCGVGHPLHGVPHDGLDWPDLRRFAFAGLGFHSPNMDLAHQAGLPRKATGFDQEGIVLLICSGRYLGFLPDHYAAAFESQGRIQSIAPARFKYSCRYSSMFRRSPEPGAAASLLIQCLSSSHRPAKAGGGGA